MCVPMCEEARDVFLHHALLLFEIGISFYCVGPGDCTQVITRLGSFVAPGLVLNAVLVSVPRP